jgi:hypothetical protein
MNLTALRKINGQNGVSIAVSDAVGTPMKGTRVTLSELGGSSMLLAWGRSWGRLVSVALVF